MLYKLSTIDADVAVDILDFFKGFNADSILDKDIDLVISSIGNPPENERIVVDISANIWNFFKTNEGVINTYVRIMNFDPEEFNLFRINL